MKKRYTVVGAAVLIVLLLSLSTSLVSANPPPIKVYKLDANGEPIEGWLMRMYKWDYSIGEWVIGREGYTDGDGMVIFDGLGNFEWRVWEEARECWEPKEPAGLSWWNGGYYIVLDLSVPPATDTITFVNEYTCDESPGTGTPGYWKNHPEAWPVEEITIGGVTYTKDEAIGYLMTAESGDKTFTMFRALVAAKLNVLIGNEDSCIVTTIAAADGWMATYGPVGSGLAASTEAWEMGEPLYEMLDAYNNGELCAPERD